MGRKVAVSFIQSGRMRASNVHQSFTVSTVFRQQVNTFFIIENSTMCVCLCLSLCVSVCGDRLPVVRMDY